MCADWKAVDGSRLLLAGAKAFLQDVPQAELHLLDTGHFALEEDAAEIAQLIGSFLAKNVR